MVKNNKDWVPRIADSYPFTGTLPRGCEKQDIVQFAWGNEYIGETSLAKSISVLRQSFIKIGIKDSPILTVPKVGYRLVEDVLLNESLVTINAPREEIVPAKPEETSQPRMPLSKSRAIET